MVLNSCEIAPLDAQLSHENFIRVFPAIYQILNAVLLKHTTTALNVIPAFISLTKRLLKVLILRSDQGGLHADQAADLVRCAGLVERYVY